MNNALRITYPKTNNEKLNNYFQKILTEKISNFLNKVSNSKEENLSCSLDITYDEYEFNEMLTYIFYISESTGRKNPANSLEVVNFNSKTNDFFTVEDLKIYDNKILEKLCLESRKRLKTNPKISSLEMLNIGTEPNASNFKNFYFTKEGIVIIFSEYQVAPSKAGMFKILIPYQVF